MQKPEYYKDAADRRAKLAAATQRGETMIHDNFIDAEGNPTDGTSGQLIFGIVPEVVPTTEEIDAREIEAETSPTLAELVRLLRFKGLIGGARP